MSETFIKLFEKKMYSFQSAAITFSHENYAVQIKHLKININDVCSLILNFSKIKLIALKTYYSNTISTYNLRKNP